MQRSVLHVWKWPHAPVVITCTLIRDIGDLTIYSTGFLNVLEWSPDLDMTILPVRLASVTLDIRVIYVRAAMMTIVAHPRTHAVNVPIRASMEQD